MRLLVVIAIILFSGCSTTIDLTQEGGYDYKGIDFREYTRNGFKFTPEKPSGKYESIGIVEVEFYPEIREIDLNQYNRAMTIQINSSSNTYEIDGKEFKVNKSSYNGVVEYYLIEQFETDSILEEMYELTSSWGANAVVNLRFDYQLFTEGLTWSSVTVRGFAIKEER
ncbi:heavy metal-binding domain-containing protein [Gracilimonas halophila]|uniref:Heavy metal-binding domain-containing protein n=1 Tax=Gracilimonas halophila TaxID=1834464 RepID=A0ABW5JG71_9BACT